MKYVAKSPEEYISQLPEDRRFAVEKLRASIKQNLPSGLEETMSYGMIGYVIPHSVYPRGYHAKPSEPVPFISIASQKHHISLYHLGLYAFPDVLAWFQDEYTKAVKTKLDMGKGCIRFRNMAHIPYDLIARLCHKISVQDFLKKYDELE